MVNIEFPCGLMSEPTLETQMGMQTGVMEFLPSRGTDQLMHGTITKPVMCVFAPLFKAQLGEPFLDI